MVWCVRKVPKRAEAVHAHAMRAGIEVTVTPEDRARLEAIARDRNAKHKHVARAKVILATAFAARGCWCRRETLRRISPPICLPGGQGQ